jgi:hypothetical protein
VEGFEGYDPEAAQIRANSAWQDIRISALSLAESMKVRPREQESPDAILFRVLPGRYASRMETTRRSSHILSMNTPLQEKLYHPGRAGESPGNFDAPENEFQLSAG